MWGYEINARDVVNDLDQRYESPCGVMSLNTLTAMPNTGRLRIPMRGYESINPIAVLMASNVTNPHAGL